MPVTDAGAEALEKGPAGSARRTVTVNAGLAMPGRIRHLRDTDPSSADIRVHPIHLRSLVEIASGKLLRSEFARRICRLREGYFARMS